jgi:hypothetical protein
MYVCNYTSVVYEAACHTLGHTIHSMPGLDSAGSQFPYAGSCEGGRLPQVAQLLRNFASFMEFSGNYWALGHHLIQLNIIHTLTSSFLRSSLILFFQPFLGLPSCLLFSLFSSEVLCRDIPWTSKLAYNRWLSWGVLRHWLITKMVDHHLSVVHVLTQHILS